MQLRKPVTNSLYDLLKGTWILTREIKDHLNNQNGFLEGTARFEPITVPGILHYKESGKIAYGEYRDFSSQTYTYRIIGDQSAELYFRDGEFFHDLSFIEGTCNVSHFCGVDLYEGRYQINSQSLKITWFVRGPRKNYELHSILLKI